MNEIPDTTPDTPAAEAPEVLVTPVAPAAPAAAATPPELSPAAVAAQLKALFPGLFAGSFKPLKLRVQADIQERAPGQFTKAQLSAFLRRYTGNTGYLIALTKASHRYDLDGQEAGEFSEEHRVAAREELARRKGLQQERVAAEQEQLALQHQQRRNRAGLLYDYERTTLTLANFCALKGVTAEELPGLLEIAKQERAEQPPRPVRDARDARDSRETRPGQRPANRPEGRGLRGDQRGGPRRPARG